MAIPFLMKTNEKIGNEDLDKFTEEKYSNISKIKENPIKKDGTEHYYGLDYGKLTPYLTKALHIHLFKLNLLTMMTVTLTVTVLSRTITKDLL